MSSHQIHLLARGDPTDGNWSNCSVSSTICSSGSEGKLRGLTGSQRGIGYRASARNIVHYWTMQQAD